MRRSVPSTRRPAHASTDTAWRCSTRCSPPSEAEWADALDRHRPRFAVIYEDSFNYLSKMCLLRMRQAALTMTDAARTRGIPTIVAGSDASDHPGDLPRRAARMSWLPARAK